MWFVRLIDYLGKMGGEVGKYLTEYSVQEIIAKTPYSSGLGLGSAWTQ